MNLSWGLIFSPTPTSSEAKILFMRSLFTEGWTVACLVYPVAQSSRTLWTRTFSHGTPLVRYYLTSSTHSQRAAFFPICYLLIFIRINNPYWEPHIFQGAGQGREGMTLMGHMFKANYIQSGRQVSKLLLCLLAMKRSLLSRLNIRNLKMVHTLKEAIIPLWERKVRDAVVDTYRKGMTLFPTNTAQRPNDYSTWHVMFILTAWHTMTYASQMASLKSPFLVPSHVYRQGYTLI